MSEVNEYKVTYEDEYRKSPDGMYGASSSDLLVAYINRTGEVDIAEMSRISGISVRELLRDLKGAVFQDPAFFENEDEVDVEKGWVIRPRYCSGNLNRKLSLAYDMNERFPGRFDDNIEVLRSMLPGFLSIDDIHIAIGSYWVPDEIYSEFLTHLLNVKTPVKVLFNDELRFYQISLPEGAKSSVNNHMVYGTVRMSAAKIFEHIINNVPVKVFDGRLTSDGRYEREFNAEATLAAQEKETLIKAAFDKWVRSDSYRCMWLEECYNEEFSGYCVGSYDGSFLQLPDLNPEVTLYPHQRNSIARILLSGKNQNHLLAQDVGSGKTYIMCVAIHELYRMGISRKNLMVCPNSVLQSTVDAFRYLYPGDKILTVCPKDFTAAHRNAVLEQIRDGDFVCVFMAESSFNMIEMSKEYHIARMTEEHESLRNAIASAQYKFEKRALESKKEKLSKKITKYILEACDTPWLSFDKLGIETLVVDEAHGYKNIPLNTRADNIVGMHTKGSKKCAEMLEKTKVVDKVIFATATPITNSIADLFVMMTYLQPEELRFRGIDTFDLWINTFGEKKTEDELDIDSSHLRVMSRFSKFHNLTELMALCSTVIDFHYTAEKDSRIPEFKGYTDVCVPKSRAQEQGMKELCERTELVRARRVPRTEDNLLKITNYGHLLSLHPGLVGLERDDGDTDKVRECAKRVYEIYRAEENTCQIVFSDIGTPKAGFNVYDCLKEELTALGIAEHEIAFIHDASSESARTKLFARMNAGTVRVAVGSTAKLGEGTNVQRRLRALHHLSIPWRPSDLTQREGRILRIGNTCREVSIFRYVTEGTFDAYTWQLLQNKQTFISDFLSGISAQRDADDVTDTVLNYAEIKALAIGNPLIKSRVETANRLERTKVAFRQRQKQLAALREVVERTPGELKALKHSHDITSKDISLYGTAKEAVPKEERLAFGEELISALRENGMMNTERYFFDYQGFKIMLPAGMDPDRPYVCVCSSNGGRYYPSMDTDKPLGCSMRIDHLLDHLPDRIRDIEEQMERAEAHRRDALEDISRGNAHKQQVESLTSMLSEIDRKLKETEMTA